MLKRSLKTRFISMSDAQRQGAAAVLTFIAATLVGTWTPGPIWTKVIVSLGVVLIGAIAIWFITPVRYCYLACDDKDLDSNTEEVSLWIESTGVLPSLSYHVSPADSESGPHDPRYFSFGPNAGGMWSPLPRGRRLIGKALKPNIFPFNVRVEFTSENSGWEEHLTIYERDGKRGQVFTLVHESGEVLKEYSSDESTKAHGP